MARFELTVAGFESRQANHLATLPDTESDDNFITGSFFGFRASNETRVCLMGCFTKNLDGFIPYLLKHPVESLFKG